MSAPCGGAQHDALRSAFATAIERLAGHAPAIGASRMGSFRPYFAQNSVAVGFRILPSSCAQGSPDDDLGFFLDALQVILTLEAFRVDFVNVFRA